MGPSPSETLHSKALHRREAKGRRPEEEALEDKALPKMTTRQIATTSSYADGLNLVYFVNLLEWRRAAARSTRSRMCSIHPGCLPLSPGLALLPRYPVAAFLLHGPRRRLPRRERGKSRKESTWLSLLHLDDTSGLPPSLPLPIFATFSPLWCTIFVFAAFFRSLSR